MTNPRWIIHIGPPKTGTTSLQERVFARHPGLCFLGKPWWTPEVPYETCVALHRAIDSVTMAPPGRFDAGTARAAIDAWLAHAPQAAPRPDGSLLPRLLSEERLMIADAVEIAEIACRLAILFPGAEIVHVRRDPVAGLKSGYYWHYARNWTDAGFSGWLTEGMTNPASRLAGLALRYYDLVGIEAAFGAHFPVVRKVDYSRLRADSTGFLATLLDLPREDFAAFRDLGDTALNASGNRAVAELHRAAKKALQLWNRLPFGKIDEKPEHLGNSALWRALEWPLRRLSWGQAKLEPTEADRLRILTYFGQRGTEPSVPDDRRTQADANGRQARTMPE